MPIVQTASINGDGGVPTGGGVSSDSRFLLAKRVVLVAGGEGEDAGEVGLLILVAIEMVIDSRLAKEQQLQWRYSPLVLPSSSLVEPSSSWGLGFFG